MKLRELWNKSSENLTANKIESGRADARLLLMYLLGYDYTKFILNLEQNVSEEKVSIFTELIDEYLSGKPLQYIIGKQEFMGLEFFVDENVLIPRGDTEILIEQVLKKVDSQQKLRIADIGTGSGIIAVTLATRLPKTNITAVDISHNALQVAKKNAEFNNVVHQIQFVKGDLLNPLLNCETKYHVIASNPPYITEEEMKTLPDNVKQEPHLALFGGADGLDFYRRLANDSGAILYDNGYLIVEIGSSQSEQVKKIFTKYGFEEVEIFNDFAKLPRVVVGKLKKTL